LVAWSSSLERFGAAQLNERYRKRFGVEMDEDAWAGWLAIKVLLDAVLRKGTADPCTLERALIAGERFDGHKGVPLFFDPLSRELVQPLFALRTSGEAEPVDVRRASDHAAPIRGGAAPCASPCT
jgi:ABC-type branched-subunit amino acid transport system substrate-binding protein